jgi:alcohol dehydrogenase
MAYRFETPEVIIAGIGAHKELKSLSELRGKTRAIFVTDNARIDQQVKSTCKRFLIELGLEIADLGPVSEFSSKDLLTGWLADLSPGRTDIVIAVGGRKAIQTGKLFALVATNGDKILDPDFNPAAANQGIPVVAVAMTAGSGAAIAHCSCFYNSDTRRHQCISNPFLMPVVAILDPGLSEWQSSNEIAIDGVVSLGYAIESIVSLSSSPVTDACALAAITAICRWLPRAFAQGSDLAAREQVMFAQQLVSMAMANCATNISCKIAGQIEILTHIPAGNIVAVVLPHMLQYYNELAPKKTEQIAAALKEGIGPAPGLGSAPAEELARHFIHRLDLPQRLGFLGFDEALIPRVIDDMSCRGAEITFPDENLAEKLFQILNAAL